MGNLVSIFGPPYTVYKTLESPKDIIKMNAFFWLIMITVKNNKLVKKPILMWIKISDNQ